MSAVKRLLEERDALIIERDEALDALHRLRAELLAGKLQASIGVRPTKIVTIRGKRYAKIPEMTRSGRLVVALKELQ